MRFVAFGCSHTWGRGILPRDIGDAPPSSASWVQVLSRKFNIPVLNLSTVGGSNLLILHAIRNHDWKTDDIALVQWTYFKRSTIFDDETIPRHILSGNIDNKDKEYIKQYYMLLPNYHIEYMNLQHIDHSYLYLEAHNIPKVARFAYNVTPVQLAGFNNNMLADYQTLSIEYVAESLEKKSGTIMRGADSMHFNAQVHEVFAEEYVSEINDLL